MLADRVVVLSALRRRSDLLPAGVRPGGKGILRRRARRHGGVPFRICPQHRDRHHRPDRQPRRQSTDHRFRAALPPIRPRVPAATALSHHRADRRPAAHHHPDAADLRLRQAAAAPFARQQSHPLFQRCDGDPAHHRRAAIADRQRGAIRGDPAACIWCSVRTSRSPAISTERAGSSPSARTITGWNGCAGCRSPTIGRKRSSAPRSR